MGKAVRYRFSEFTLSPQRRLLLREEQEVPIIPRYFDLLLLLIERRREAIHRDEIFDKVWGDVSVSDSALSQAVRTIRRTLGDDSREPRFIRTVSRHGYQFVFAAVHEEDEGGEDEGHGTHEAPEGNEGHEGTKAHLASVRATGGAAGGALAGICSGGVGGLLLFLAPGSTAPLAIAPVLAVIGGAIGGLGGAGVGAGLGFGEATVPSRRAAALTAGAALGGGLIGAAVQWLAWWALDALVGIDIRIGGGLEGVMIGAAAGLGFSIGTVGTPHAFVPRWGTRLHAALIIAILCGMAGLALTLAGRPLAGGTIHVIADAAEGSRATLEPLARLIGETNFGLLTGAIIAFGEAATFGVGLAFGLIRRP
jgi:DNA-binding winged helix-turn-helix (wHTH) protein